MSQASLPRGILVDPSRPLSFTFEGRRIPALAGQSIGAALYAAGVRVFSRSFKYHRPRGLFCVSGDCPNCLMQVDGRPNVRTCVEPVAEGMVVYRQNAWPSADFDVLRAFDKLDRFLPVGFYYKRFHKPRWLWPIFEHTVRHVAGLGRIDVRATPELDGEVQHLQAEVCVIGGGPAGMAAAEAAALAGADVLLLERQPQFGVESQGLLGLSPALSEMLRTLLGSGRVRTSYGTHAFGLYEGNLVAAVRGGTLLKIRARQVIVCTGSRERPFVFHNNDLPGVFLSRGVRRLAGLYGVRPGRRAVVVTDNDEGLITALGMNRLGIEVVRLLDRRAAVGLRGSEPFDRFGSRATSRGVILAALGGQHLKAVRVARQNEDGTVDAASVEEIPCDLLIMAGEPVPANELLLQGGMRFRHEGGRWLAEGGVPGLWAAGGAAGTMRLAARTAEGRLRGAEAAAALGRPVPLLDEYRREWEASQAPAPTSSGEILCPQAQPHDRKRFVCLCEDVTEKDLCDAVAEGFENVETLKRYSTFSMGPCQGKVCGLTAGEICARATGKEPGAVGVTTSRPPAVPVELSVLAAAQRHHPVRRTPLHHWHAAHGARWLDAGQWKRPESYGDPAAEVRAVREGVGLIDVSTLGKVEVVGPDAAELLERVYVNRWADLKPGRARYGVMCTEEGVLFDDGVAARLDADSFYLTATTGNAEAVVGWLDLWRATWRLDVTVIAQTSAFAAMNLAGPRSRDVLGRLTKIDLTTEAFPYMALREADVAGVQCRLLRIGFVGELGYEIHCPSADAWHLWEAIVAAGAEFGLRPFGVEAQRVLRLEKGHLIIGQDTDALSTPLDAGLAGMVRFEKPLFIGRGPLLQTRDAEPRQRLVGFVTAEPARVPPEGSQVVEGRRPVGRVTSARFSPTLRRAVGLAWVPARSASPGDRFLIHADGVDISAEVSMLPFYDPEGRRLRT